MIHLNVLKERLKISVTPEFFVRLEPMTTSSFCPCVNIHAITDCSLVLFLPFKVSISTGTVWIAMENGLISPAMEK